MGPPKPVPPKSFLPLRAAWYHLRATQCATRGSLEHPMDPGRRPGSVGIVAYEGDFPPSFGPAGPVQGRTEIHPAPRPCVRPYLSLEGSFGPLRWLYQPCLNKGRSHALIVPRQLPARPRFHQVPKERYLFVLRAMSCSTSCTNLTSEVEYHHQGVA
jgi:hypothetical protein